MSVTAHTSLDRPRAGDAPITLTLSRPLTAADGALVVVAGAVDLSALTTVSGTLVTIAPGAFAIPSGAQTLSVLLQQPGRFTSIGTFRLTIQFPGGFTVADVTPRIDVSSTGVAAAGGTAAGTRRAQQAGGTVAISTRHERGALTIESTSSMIGVADAERALRAAQLGDRAPLLDLASYRVAVRAPGLTVDLGHVSMGNSRHLASGMSARGVLLQTGPRRARLALGSVAGTSLVGWDNLLGVGEGSHRINSAALDVDLLSSRPGGLQVKLAGLDGALKPLAGFTQGAVVDAEASRGGSIEVAATTPGQRGRVAAGYTVSAFQNPLRDTALTGGLPVTALARDRRGARYLEGNLSLLQGRVFRKGTPGVSLSLSGRHERIDPLFRSVGAFVQADRRQEALDLSASIGSVALQGSATTGRDNLANIASILTSLTEGQAATVTFPMASLLRMKPRLFLPRVAVNWMGTHQYAQAAPASNDFRPQDLANQMSTQRNGTLQWSGDRWSLIFRDALARQDNRQPTRELADFLNRSHGLSVARSLGPRLDLSFEGSVEEQRNLERNEAARTRRLGVVSSWRPHPFTSMSTNITAARSLTPPSTRETTNLEMRAELTHRVRLYGRGADARTGQAFLRYARTLQRALPFGEPVGAGLVSTMQWTLNTGLSLTLR